MRLMRIVSIFLVTAAIFGCGYRLGGGPSAYPQIRTVAIPVFRNETFEPSLEIAITSALKEAIIRDGRWRVVDYPEGADARLEGRLASFDRTPLSFSVTKVVTQYRVTVRADIRLVERSTSKILWQDRGLSGHAEYFLTPDIAQTRSAEDRAIREAAANLGETTAARFLDGF